MQSRFLVGVLWLALAASPAAAGPKEDLSEGAKALERGDSLVALTKLRSAIESGGLSSGDLARAYALRGRVYLKNGDIDLAVSDVDAAVRTSPSSLEALEARCRVNLHRGRAKAAFDDAEAALKIDDGFGKAYDCRGSALFVSRQFDQALVDFDRAIKAKAADAYTYASRALVFALSGKYDPAIESFGRALSLGNRESASVRSEWHMNRGRAFASKGDLAKAVQDFSSAIQLDNQPLSKANKTEARGVAYARQGKFDLAIKDFSDAMSLASKAPDVFRGNLLVNRGRAYAGAGDVQRAISDFTRAIDTHKRDVPGEVRATWHVMRARAHTSIGEKSKAVSDYDAALALKPREMSELYVERGDVHARIGQQAKAAADFDAAVAAGQRNPLAFSRRAWLKADRGDFKAAVADATKAVELSEGRKEFLLDRGSIRFLSRDFGGAARDFQSMIKVDPDDSYAKLWRYLATARAGAPEKAALRGGSRNAWPDALLGLFDGSKSPDAIVDAAEAGSSEGRAGRLCEAWFAIGQHHLIAGRKADAKRAFERALATKAETFIEYAAAKVELKRL